MASRVAATTSSALEHGLLKGKQPSFYQALLNNPPPKYAARSRIKPPADQEVSKQPARPVDFTKRQRDNAKTRAKALLKPQPIEWAKHDAVRAQFYREHPWEMNRAHLFTEGLEVGDDLEGKPVGRDWVELSQRSRNPSATDVVDYTLNLHENFNMPLYKAYTACISQFRALRAVYEVANRFAQNEAEAYGAVFTARGYIGAGVLAEEKYLNKWNAAGSDGGSSASVATATSILEPPSEASRSKDTWSGGLDYLRAKALPNTIQSAD